MKHATQNQTNLLPVILWIVPVLLGFAILLDYHSRSGPATSPPLCWPSASRLNQESGKSTLLMFLHPRCPCSNATISELARLLPRLQDSKAVALLVMPPGTAPQFADTALAERCRRIPNLSVKLDVDGAEARIFKTVTSGEALLYDQTGNLRFCGGITPGRGHEGDSIGKDRIEAITRNMALKQEQALAGSHASIAKPFSCGVFGCSLLNERAPISRFTGGDAKGRPRHARPPDKTQGEPGSAQ